MTNKIDPIYHDGKGWTLVNKGESAEKDLYIIDTITSEPLYWDTKIEAENFIENTIQENSAS